MKTLVLLLLTVCFSALSGQEEESTIIQEGIPVFGTFRDTRIINSHSVEVLPARKLDFRVAHRFGDIAGAAGGWPTFYGLENASDIMIGFEYGLNDAMTIGINRTKGSGPLRQNINGILKMAVFHQEKKGNLPFSFTLVGNSSYSTMQSSSVPGSLTSFEQTSHRLAYHLGLLFARKFSDYFSIQLSTGWTYRSLVPADDQNDLASLGVAFRLNVSKALALIFDATLPAFSDLRTSENGYYAPLGIGLEWDTGGGHVFQINVTNATGLNETDFIPYTQTNWGDGEYRLGFTISRLFSL